LIHSAVRQLSHSVYYTRSLHDALPISSNSRVVAAVEAGICLETFISGSSALMGSWKIMAIFLPRSFDISRSDNPSSSRPWKVIRSEEHTSELQSRFDLVCRLLLENKK